MLVHHIGRFHYRDKGGDRAECSVWVYKHNKEITVIYSAPDTLYLGSNWDENAEIIATELQYQHGLRAQHYIEHFPAGGPYRYFPKGDYWSPVEEETFDYVVFDNRPEPGLLFGTPVREEFTRKKAEMLCGGRVLENPFKP